MPLLSRLTSAACEELEWTCLLSLSMLVISTSFREWPNAMMGQELMNTVSTIVPAKNEQSRVGKERLKVIKQLICTRKQIEDFEVLF